MFVNLHAGGNLYLLLAQKRQTKSNEIKQEKGGEREGERRPGFVYYFWSSWRFWQEALFKLPFSAVLHTQTLQSPWFQLY